MFRALSTIHPHMRRFSKPMIRQDTSIVAKKKFSSVIRCMDVGKTLHGSVIAVGSQDKKLYLLDKNFHDIQVILFSHWVRSVALGDLTGDGNDELIVGGGDKILHIFKFDENKGKFVKIYEYVFDHFVNSCIITDVTGDHELEILVGAWDKTIHALKLFSNRNQYILSLLWVKHCEKRVNVLKAVDVNSDGRNEIIVLFKGGGLEVYSTKLCEHIWSFPTEKELLAVEVGPIDQEGYPYIITGGDDAVLYFLNRKGELIHQFNTKDRITALSLEDVDGDLNLDLVLSEGDKVIRAFKFHGDSPQSNEIKWIHRIHSTNNCLLITDINQDSQNEILFGGYQSILTAIRDNYYGAEEAFFIRKTL